MGNCGGWKGSKGGGSDGGSPVGSGKGGKKGAGDAINGGGGKGKGNKGKGNGDSISGVTSTGENGGGELKAGSTPVSTKGATTLPILRFTSNNSVSKSRTVPPPTESWNHIVSPPSSAYSVIENIAWPAYGPKGGAEGDSNTPRTSVPTNAVSVPDD